MDDQFFTDSQHLSQHTANQAFTQQNNEDDEFNFNDSNNHVQLGNLVNSSSAGSFQNDETLRRIREDQQRIQEKLRVQSNQQYEEKQKRKEAGLKQYEEFMSKKESETASRRQENIQRQKDLIERNQQLSQQAGWHKVAANVALKQGEHKGKKEITRMRESIINKKNDLSK